MRLPVGSHQSTSHRIGNVIVRAWRFVNDYWVREPGKRRGHSFRVFWNVRPSGDYEADCITGERLALEYLAYAREALRSGFAGSSNLGLPG